jgi:serine phosphatase RsbU (regulator of sigma subunit)
VSALAQALSAAVRPGQVLDVLADVGRPLVGAQSINISLLDRTEQSLRLVVSRRSAPQLRMQFASYPVDAPYPTCDVVTTRMPVFIHTLEERDRRYPALASIEVDQRAWAVLPLLAGERLLGTVGLGWADPQAFDADLVQGCEQVAGLTAAALARAQLFDDMDQARTAAEDLARRLGVLQTLTGQLAEATDLGTVGDLVVEAGLGVLGADAATVGLLDDRTTFTAMASVGVPDGLIPRWSTHDVSNSPQVRDLLSQRRPVVVTSLADRDARFPDSTRTDDTFHASATLPLVTGGSLVGVLAYAWRQPRTFDEHDLAYLSAIASNAATAIDRSQLLVRTNQVAETLQRALMPEAVVAGAGWDVASRYVPAIEGTHVGGDWYDGFRAADGRLVLVLGDVAGKGVRAAAVMGAVRSAVRAYARREPTPSTVLAHLDDYFAAFKPEEMVTCALVVLTPDTGDLIYASAGHLPPLIVDGHSVRWLDRATTPPLGANTGVQRLQAHDRVEDGEVLLLFTDGLVERRDQDIYESLDRLGAAAGRLTVDDLADATHELIQELAHPAKVVDDTALLALRRRCS